MNSVMSSVRTVKMLCHFVVEEQPKHDVHAYQHEGDRAGEKCSNSGQEVSSLRNGLGHPKMNQPATPSRGTTATAIINSGAGSLPVLSGGFSGGYSFFIRD